MSVRIKIYDAYQQATGGEKVVSVEGRTVRECFESLVKKYPDMWKFIYDGEDFVCPHLLISLNGTIIDHDNLDMPVKDSDEIFPLVMIAGG